MKQLSLFLQCLFLLVLSADAAQLIIFSYDRPLQLYALLESVKKYVKNADPIQVIYRADSNAMECGYQEVASEFNTVEFVRQSKCPREDFKPLLMGVLNSSDAPYVIFAVDDNIVTDYCDLDECADLVEKTHAYGFYLGLAPHLDYCYSMQSSQRVPPLVTVTPEIYGWCFVQGEHDWNYPHMVDMALYRKSDVARYFRVLSFWAPNSLEGAWARKAHEIIRYYGLCFSHAKVINIPLNLVQSECPNNPNMCAFSAQELLDMWIQGYKIDIDSLHQFTNRARHVDHMPTFIAR